MHTVNVGDIIECSISNKYWENIKGKVTEIHGDFLKLRGFVGQVPFSSVHKINGIVVRKL